MCRLSLVIGLSIGTLALAACDDGGDSVVGPAPLPSEIQATIPSGMELSTNPAADPDGDGVFDPTLTYGPRVGGRTLQVGLSVMIDGNVTTFTEGNDFFEFAVRDLTGDGWDDFIMGWEELPLTRVMTFSEGQWLEYCRINRYDLTGC